MENKVNNKVVYDYESRGEVVHRQVLETLDYMYSLARPLYEKTFTEICKELNNERLAENGDENWRKTYCDGKYMWPTDFFYLPHDVQRKIVDNRQEAYGIGNYYEDVMKHLIENLYKGGGIHEVYTPTSWSDGKNVRHCIDVDTIDKIIGEDAATKLKAVLEGYARTYCWGRRELNQFLSLWWSSPSTNRETVKSAWKDAFNIDVEIPEDSAWVDIYYEGSETENFNEPTEE